MKKSGTLSDESLEQAYYDDYLAERKLLIDAEFASARSLDRHLIALSSAALALSITFIDKIAPHPVCTRTISLAWAMFIVALITELVSFHLCQASMRKQRDLNDAAFVRCHKLDGVAPNPYVRWQQVLTWCALISFVLGTCFLIRFSAVNLYHKECTMRHPSSPQPPKGPTPPTPVTRPPAPGTVRNPAPAPNPPAPRPSNPPPQPGR